MTEALSKMNPGQEQPQRQLSDALTKEYLALNSWQRLSCFVYLFVLSSCLYLQGDLTIARLQELAAAGDGEKRSFVAEAGSNYGNFLRAALRVNPLFSIAPLFFVSLVSLLNMQAELVLKDAALLRAAWRSYYTNLSSRFSDPRWIRDFTLDVRPLILTPLCVAPPCMILFMALNTVRPLVQKLWPKPPENTAYGIECLRLRQRIDDSLSPGRVDFYNAPWFNWVVVAPFLMGLPAMVSVWLYWHLGLDPLFGYPSHSPRFFPVFTVILMYIYALGWCASTLFFRSYFTFAWNFISCEYDLELYPDMIKRLPIKGWFLDFLSMRGYGGLQEIRWTDVTAVSFGGGRLSSELSAQEQPMLAFVKKLATLYENIAAKLDVRSDELLIEAKGRQISINLFELTSEQKSALFVALRKYAPSIRLDPAVQQALIGTTVLQEPRYTEIWFSVLARNAGDNAVGELSRGDKLQEGRYSVKAKIASGGQAVVYQAIDENGEMVVLKEYQLTAGESLDIMIESARDFENESSILEQLSHPAIVKILDKFFERGRVYIALEHVKGKSLRQMVSERGALSASQIVSLSKQMCSILEYLHKQEPPVVHRDFTPDNIIIQPNGQLKLIDFSVSQRCLESQLMHCAGKHCYTPPEQFRGQACPQSDIYALGAMLYYLACGRDPAAISVSELPQSSSAELLKLNTVITGCTQLSLNQRYESVAWVLNELLAVGSTLPAARLAIGRESFQRTMSSAREKIVLRESGSNWTKIRRETAGHRHLTNPL